MFFHALKIVPFLSYLVYAHKVRAFLCVKSQILSNTRNIHRPTNLNRLNFIIWGKYMQEKLSRFFSFLVQIF